MWKKVLLGGAAAFVFLIVIGLMTPQKSRQQRITEGCQREFGDRGAVAVNDCRIKLMIKAIDLDDAERLKRANE